MENADLGVETGTRLRTMRRERKLGQNHIADGLEISVSEISRLERGLRGVRVAQLGPWAKSLNNDVAIVFFENDGEQLAAEDLELLAKVAESLHHLPPPAKAALASQMNLWRGTGEAVNK